MPYLGASAIEAQIGTLGSAAPASRLAMHEATASEGIGPTSYSYLKIGNGSGAGRPTVLIVAGMHARELAQPDAVLSFADKLLTAYRSSKAFTIPAYTDPAGRTVGPVTIDAPRVKRLVDTIDLLLVPLANPDGRAFALAAPANIDWRKNRAPRVVAADPATVGVDLNRNFDIAWDFEIYLDTTAAADLETRSTSKNAARDTFIGQPTQGPASQPETRNLVWILDHHPVTYAIDLHSKKGKVMYPWGIEENGFTAAQNFRDHSFDRSGPGTLKRDGILGSAYSEFFPDGPVVTLRTTHDRLAKSMVDRIRQATGRSYDKGPIAMTIYPATGSLTDYAFSRQFTIAGSPPIYSFAIEFGFEVDGFRPLYADPHGFPRIEREVHAALWAFVEAVVPSPIGGGGGGGGAGGFCPFTVAAVGLAAGPAWLETLREGRGWLRKHRSTRGVMVIAEALYGRLGLHLVPRLRRSPRARLIVAYGLVRPLAGLTARLLRLTAS